MAQASGRKVGARESIWSDSLAKTTRPRKKKESPKQPDPGKKKIESPALKQVLNSPKLRLCHKTCQIQISGGSQPAQQPASQPVSQPASQPAGGPVSQPTIQPVSQPASQLASQPAICPGSEAAWQPTSPPASQPGRQLGSQPANQSASQQGIRL